MNRVAITGNTYRVKDQIRALGGRWNADAKAWMVAADKADEAKALVAGAPTTTVKRRYFKCAECGAPSKGYYRCYNCSLDYREGGGMYAGGVSYRDRNGNFVLGDDD